MVRLPSGDGNHVAHARCVLVTVRSDGAQRGIQEPLVCSDRGCGAHNGRRKALDAAVQADPDLRDAPVSLRGGPEEDVKGQGHGLCYPWDHDSLEVADPLECP